MHTAFASLFHRLPGCAHPGPCPVDPENLYPLKTLCFEGSVLQRFLCQAA